MSPIATQTGCLSSFQSSAENSPPRIAIVNIMDNADGTRRHLLNILNEANPNTEITLCRMSCAKKDPKYFKEQDHLLSDIYVDWHDVIGVKDFDLVIVTGINRGTLSYQDLTKKYPDFWTESQELFHAIHDSIYAGKTGHSAFICWSAFAAMKTLFGVEKGIRPEKLYGLFEHKIVSPDHPLAKGLGTETILIPQSRSSFMKEHELNKVIADHGGEIVMSAERDGAAIWTLEDNRITCFINHPEYSFDTLAREYKRDANNNPDFPKPENYDPDNFLSPTNLKTFAKLASTCTHFYKNLIELAQTQKKEHNIPVYEEEFPPAVAKRSAAR